MRSLGVFILGLAVGLFVGALFGGRVWQAATADASSRSWNKKRHALAATAASADERRIEDQKILLGDITAVPFQELYEMLSHQTPVEIAQMAEQLDRLPRDKEADGKISAFFKAWAHLDAAAAFKSAVAFKTAEARTVAINATIAGADASVAGLLARSINSLADGMVPASQKPGLFGLAVERWSESDPAGAAKLLGETQAPGIKFTTAYYTVAQNWAATDPQAALAWAQDHTAGSSGLSAINGALNGWWQKDHEAAEAYAVAQINTPEGRQLINSIASQIANEDRTKAQAWISRLPNDEVRHQAETILASQWAFSDPEAASAWAVTLPTEERQGALDSTIAMWARSDPAAAGEWMENLSGAIRDQAVSSYSMNIAENDPAAAAAWATTITDQNTRERALQSIATQWLNRDAGAARAWIQSSSLPDAQKTHLLALVPGK
jgi:hypothetical protein